MAGQDHAEEFRNKYRGKKTMMAGQEDHAEKSQREIPVIKNTYYEAAHAQNTYALSLRQAFQQSVTPVPWNAGEHKTLEKQLRDSLKLEAEKMDMQIDTRLVKVFIVDPTESLPVEDRMVYKSDEILTDKTDQELFFDIDVKSLLEGHNSKRIQVRDKKAKANFDRSIPFLEPARVRDLKMTVVVLAQF